MLRKEVGSHETKITPEYLEAMVNELAKKASTLEQMLLSAKEKQIPLNFSPETLRLLSGLSAEEIQSKLLEASYLLDTLKTKGLLHKPVGVKMQLSLE